MLALSTLGPIHVCSGVMKNSVPLLSRSWGKSAGGVGRETQISEKKQEATDSVASCFSILPYLQNLFTVFTKPLQVWEDCVKIDPRQA